MRTLDIEHLKTLVSSHKLSAGGHRSSPRRRAIKILAILERDDFKCVKCGNNEDLTIDHPFGREFSKHDNSQKYQLDKCRILCKPCHLKRHDIMEVKNGNKL